MATKELRHLASSQPSAAGRRITGYAILFGVRSQNLGASEPWFEIIERGALPDLATQDVRCLFNHDANQVLACSKYGKGSLRLTIDSRGLKYQFEAPNTTLGSDLLESVRRGDIDQSSFSFTLAKEGARWTREGGDRIRRVSRIEKLHDVSPVTVPAYAETTVAARKSAARSTGGIFSNPRFTTEDVKAIFGIR